MGWLFSHPTRDALIAELTADGETDNCTRTVIDHHLVDNVLWQIVKLVPKRDGIFPGVAAGEACTLIGCDLLDVHGGRWGHKYWMKARAPSTGVARCTFFLWPPTASIPNGAMASGDTTRRAERLPSPTSGQPPLGALPPSGADDAPLPYR